MSVHPTIKVLLFQLLLSKNAWRQFQKKKVSLCLFLSLSARCCIPLHSSRSTMWGFGGWRGATVLRAYRTCFNGQALGTFFPQKGYNGHSPITVCWGTGACWLIQRNPQSPPCLPLPPWSAHRNMLPNQTPTDEKQIQRRQPYYLTGSKWLGEFKRVIHVPPKPRLGQL